MFLRTVFPQRILKTHFSHILNWFLKSCGLETKEGGRKWVLITKASILGNQRHYRKLALVCGYALAESDPKQSFFKDDMEVQA